jgi:uncharacterized repeat protein (TIGR01451 family)
MKTKLSASSKRTACAAMAVAALCPSAAAAAGVAAGSSIENTATATYSVGATTDSVESNTVSILVDELLDVTVSSLDAGNVPLDASGAVLSFEIVNIGNGPEAFELTIDPARTGDDFDAAVVQIAYDSNGNGTYDAGVDTVIPVGGSTPSIDADGTLRVFVVTQLAGSPGDGDTADVRLTAAATTGTGSPGTIFAGQGEGGGDAVVGVGTAEDFDDGRLAASLSTVSLVKSAAIADPFGGTQAVPGARVTYTLVANVAGTASVSGLTIADPIPVGTTYDANSLTLESAPLTDAAGDDAGEADAAGIAVDLGTVAGGASRTIRFSVTIDQ